VENETNIWKEKTNKRGTELCIELREAEGIKLILLYCVAMEYSFPFPKQFSLNIIDHVGCKDFDSLVDELGPL
jgi:hypothetical protein